MRVSYIDIKKSIIPDAIMFPAIMFLLLIKYFDTSLGLQDMIAVTIVLVIFIIPIVLNMAFGGGDLRFGAFCALFLGLELVGWFILLSGLIHILILAMLRKKSFGFAPAMSLASIFAYLIGKL